MKLSSTYKFLTDDLNKIELELLETIQAEHPVLRAASTQLLKAGGKRIRPVFVLLSAKLGEYNFEQIKHVAVALELMHMASLVHDDVIDDANIRRGKHTVNAKWDNRVAMYTGDYIFARSLEILAKIDNPKAHQQLSNTIVELCLGEIEQLKDQYNVDQNLRTYLRRIKRKTALLIASSCRLGAIVSNLEPKYEKALFRYGYYLGMSYQIIDDILDFTASEKELGKPAGSDLKQGNITLPVLYQLSDPNFKEHLEHAFQRANIDNENLEAIIKIIKESPSIKQAYQLSENYLQKAEKELSIFPVNQATVALKDIAKYIGSRTF
ncbi:heptaprenyl diphosphate synthase [Salirhabdus euzebyi]|uniref:Heptaprenyl diphosphate synthase component 2 n=1 Tax=Salirhabdus euzebyi TaxID=394506 RepID=A0A841PWH3_9BACI|nr:heptaprenyl diphosphate synthase component II [Salirhabdus euzebyi]MBB6452204.1 heptaprenyl diphosphate synthase [Salirhabdus euzebyi]